MGEQSVIYVAVELDGMFAENVDEGEDVGGVFTLVRLPSVRCGLYRGEGGCTTCLRANHFSTSFDEGPSEPKRFGRVPIQSMRAQKCAI